MAIYTKICRTCKISQPLSAFNKCKATTDQLQSECKSCQKEYRNRKENKKRASELSKECYKLNKEQYLAARKKYREDNKKLVKEQNKRYRKDNKETLARANRQYREDNKERLKLNDRKYREDNSERLKQQAKVRARKRRASDPLFALIGRIRARILLSLRTKGYTKKSRTYEILGCSFEEFKQHIELQFTEGMSWQNRSEWHIDHITPVSWGRSEEEIIALNHFSNLRPSWSEDNWAKSNKYSG